MIEINIDPNLLQLGPLFITWHGLFSAIGLAIGIWITATLVAGSEVTADDVYTIAMAAVPAGIIGARLLYVFENWWLFADRPLAILALNEGGISIYGAVIGGSIAGALFAAYTRRPIAYIADRAGIGLIVGQGIGRIGDIINGEHHGKEAAGLPWGVTYTHPNTLGEPGMPVHLAVGYELVYDLAAGALLYWLLRRGVGGGVVYVIYLVLYAFGRLWVGFFRKDVLVVDGLGMAQFIGVLSLVVAVPWLAWLLRDRRPAPRAQRRRGGR